MYDFKKQKNVLRNNKRITVLNTTIDVLNMKETVHLVEKYVIQKEPLHLIGVNADKISKLNSNERLKQIVNSCGIINADGASVIIASKYLHTPLPERVAGIDLMQNLVALSEKKGYSVYLLGAKEAIVNETVKVLKNKHPQLNIIGYRNGYFTENEWLTISKELKEKNPDFVFVGISSPLKEYLVEFFLDDGNSSVFMGVGGSFDVISGKIARAPQWMQKMSLEWLFRVMQEPKRLFKRYFVGNFLFIRSIIKEK